MGRAAIIGAVELKRYPLGYMTLGRPEPRAVSDDVALDRVIAERGIEVPVLVTPIGEKLFEVIDEYGERQVTRARQVAARGRLAAHLHYVPCCVIDVQSPTDRARWRLISGVFRRAMAPDDVRALAILSGLPFIASSGEADAGGAGTQRALIDVVSGICERRQGIRGARRIMEVLETASLYVEGRVTFQETMDRLRRSEPE